MTHLYYHILSHEHYYIDLLAENSNSQRYGGLRLKESPTVDLFVEDLSWIEIKDFEGLFGSLHQKLLRGFTDRSIYVYTQGFILPTREG